MLDEDGFEPGITVCIPSISPRSKYLAEAVASVSKQTLTPEAVSIAYDLNHEGAGPTRMRAIKAAKTTWIALMDDDDLLYPTHLAQLYSFALEMHCDIVFPWFDVINGTDPFKSFEGLPWSNDQVRIFPITTLVRNKYAQQANWPAPSGEADWAGDDLPAWQSMMQAGARIQHLNSRTWAWRHGGHNLSGLAKHPDGTNRW